MASRRGCDVLQTNIADYLMYGLLMLDIRHFGITLACLCICMPINMTSSVVSRHSSLSDVTTPGPYGSTPEYIPADNNELDLINGILINELYICDNYPFVIIFVHSAPGNIKQRTAIRESWGSVSQDPDYQTIVLFLLGVTPHDVTSSEIRSESETYHDILQFNIADSYKNLSLKSLAMIQWTNSFCRNVKYVVKVDDDTFLNTPLLVSDLHSVVHKRFLMGNLIAGARPIRDKKSKYFTPIRQFSGAMYPTYLSGAAYVISGDVIQDLTEAAKTTELFWLEDVYVTGLLARRAKAKHIFNGKFDFQIQSLVPCQLTRIIALHRINPNEIITAWKLIEMCKRET